MTSHGLKDASTDPAQIQDWWGRWPDANVGLRTGVAFDVLDLDGPVAIAALERFAPGYKHHGPVGGTGKGYHLLFGVTNAPNGANLGGSPESPTKIDFRGQNGYIVAPPSIHPNGHSYRWVRAPELPLPEPEYWLLDLVFPKPTYEPVGRDLPPSVESLVAGLDLEREFNAIGVQFRKRGTLREGICPFHTEKTPSLKLYPNDTFYCFGCGAWGDALNVRHFAETGDLR